MPLLFAYFAVVMYRVYGNKVFIVQVGTLAMESLLFRKPADTTANLVDAFVVFPHESRHILELGLYTSNYITIVVLISP